MKISLNWLKDYIDLTDISTDDLVEKLTMSGLEVESAVDESKKFKNFVVGYVKEKKKHPNADKLSVCIVSNGYTDLQVVCGAPNVNAGQKVVFAQIGANIPNGNFEIKKAKLRGVESFGMLCSESELELSEDHSGIMILDPDIDEGTPISKALGLNDVIMEIGVTPNRPDALSHSGVARDIAALYNRELKLPELNLNETEVDIKSLAEIIIEDVVHCPRYSSKVLTGIEVKESPEWLKRRLTKIGLRPRNNIVDITNYVMHELGQPLHAFDLDKLAGKKIIVKSLDKAETFTTLDSKERKLIPGTLMICDADRTVAIAGVMGGENSEINNETKNILIESAYFNSTSIRKTSKYLGLSTDASYRFERGTNPEGTAYAAERAAQLINELAGGKIAKGIIDVYPRKIEEKIVKVRLERINKILGYHVPEESIKQILNTLGIRLLEAGNRELKTSIPAFRPDIEREIDVIEEVARIYGYDSIPVVEKISSTLAVKYDESSFVDEMRNLAVGLGFYEMINNPLQSEQASGMYGSKIPLLNPQSTDMAYLRTSLVPGALQVVSQNIKHGEKDQLLFEIGNVFNKKQEAEVTSFEDFTEETKLILAITGKISDKEWNSELENFDFYSLKGIINSFNRKILLDNVLNDSYYLSQETFFDYTLALHYKEITAGLGGRVDKNVLKQFDINQDVFCFEYKLDILKKIPKPPKRYKDVLKYPKVFRDFAFVFDKAVNYGEVKEYIEKNGSGLLKSVRIFDLFENNSLGNNKKSMAFALEFFDAERTLNEEEIDNEFNNLIKSVSDKFDAKLRGM